ncbi:MAG: hypothetical protein EBQ49_03030, partial [Verrucomicrobia bacterium]|nr:hypothetical protein [Verrucomicrobiota bacterium]
IAQPPLYRIKRKKREQYVDNDADLNRILLELGSEDVNLLRLRDKHVFPGQKLDKIVESLARLESLGVSISRTGCQLGNYSISKITRTMRYLVSSFVHVRAMKRLTSSSKMRMQSKTT